MPGLNWLVVVDSNMSRTILRKTFGDAHAVWQSAEGVNGQDSVDQAIRPTAKITFLTANIQASTRNLAVELKINFIPKPISAMKIGRYVR